MPVHKVGYRKWSGERTPSWSRWWIITESGFKIAFTSTWVRRLLLACWLPVLYWGVGLFIVEQALERNAFQTQDTELAEIASLADLSNQIENEVNEELTKKIIDELDMLPQVEVLTAAIATRDKSEIRHTIWSWLMMTFFRYPQGTAMLFLLGLVTPGLISQDVRSRAFLLYFSRPIGRIEYLLGKIMIPVVFVAFITVLPAICLFAFGVSLSPDLSVLNSTWDIPLRIILCSVVVVLPTCSLALMLSSVTQETRFASFAWFAVWALGHATWFAITITQAVRLGQPPTSSEVMNDPIVRDWSVVSLYNNLSNVQAWIFGFQDFSVVAPSLFVLIALTVVSLYILYRGVSAPMNV